jgi:hypothetical protein
MRRPRHRCRLLAGGLHEARRDGSLHVVELFDHDDAVEHREPRHQFEQQQHAGQHQRHGQQQQQHVAELEQREHQLDGRIGHGLHEQLQHAEFHLGIERHEQLFEHHAVVEHVEQHDHDALIS